MMKKFFAIACACLVWLSSMIATAQYWGGWWGGSTNFAWSRNSTLFLDTCPGGDYSPSFYDGECGVKPEYDLNIDLSITDPYTCGGDIFGRVISDDLENTNVTLTLAGARSYSFAPTLDSDGMYRQDVSTVADGQYTVTYTASDIHGNTDSTSYSVYIQASCMIDAPVVDTPDQEFNNLLDTGAGTDSNSINVGRIDPNTDLRGYITQRNQNEEEVAFTVSFLLPDFIPKTWVPATGPVKAEPELVQHDLATIIKTVTNNNNKTNTWFVLPKSLPDTGASL